MLFVWVIALPLPPLFASVENTAATRLNEHFPFLPSDVAPSSDAPSSDLIILSRQLSAALFGSTELSPFFSPLFLFAPEKRRQTQTTKCASTMRRAVR